MFLRDSPEFYGADRREGTRGVNGPRENGEIVSKMVLPSSWGYDRGLGFRLAVNVGGKRAESGETVIWILEMKELYRFLPFS